MKVDVLIALMAVQEAVFFAPLARRLAEEEGLDVAFLTFHEAADDVLEKHGLPFFSLHKIKRAAGKDAPVRAGAEDVRRALGLDLKRLAAHESMTTNRRKEAYLASKVMNYNRIIDGVLSSNEVRCVVQELGGFIAPQLLYHIATRRRVEHFFIEPAMFPKRVVFTRNALYADIPDYGVGNGSSPGKELSTLLERYLNEKTVVVPKKDRHFFRDMGLARLLSPDNFRRLARKLYHKYVLGREEEYNAIFWYVSYHVLKMLRRKLLGLYYSEPVGGKRYVYYPFHVPLDVQLTVRCPEFLDQEALVGRIAKSLPAGYMLYVKEHPAAIGGHGFRRLRRAVMESGNIRLIHPGRNSFDLIREAGCVVTVNSKVGFEAIMQGRPVVVLGKAFYRAKGVTVDVDDMAGLPRAILAALGPSGRPDPKKRDRLLARAFNWTSSGELYEHSPRNMEDFYLSLRALLANSGITGRKYKELEGALK